MATPTPVAEGKLARAIYLNLWGLGVQSLDVTYDVGQRQVKVTITLGGTVPNTDVKVSAAQELTKAFCLMAHQAIWTSGVPVDQATVYVMGPEQDPYSGVLTEVYGEAIVRADSAQHVGWSNITANEAWAFYDQTFLREAFQDVD